MTAFRIADEVAWVGPDDLDDDTGPTAYAALLPGGRPMALEGSACLVWLALADGGTLEQVVAATAALAGTEPQEITDDVAALLVSLRAVGLVRAD